MTMKKFLIILLLFGMLSCSDHNFEPKQQFPLTRMDTLKFEYFFDFDDQQLPGSGEQLEIETVNGLRFKNKSYVGFTRVDKSQSLFNGDDSILIFNFLPIRYQDGQYFEYRYDHEVIILKDNVKKGDRWKTHFSNNDRSVTTHTFDVVEKYAVYEKFGIQYYDVFQVRETWHNNSRNNYDDALTMHYYNKDRGIIRREMPVYVSGTYGAVIFNRID